MKPFWALVCCVACFLIGCNVGEERVKAKIRAALQKAGEAMENAAQSIDTRSLFEVSPEAQPRRGTSAEDMRDLLNRKDREIEMRQATNR
jgi:hypothetical protein